MKQFGRTVLAFEVWLVLGIQCRQDSESLQIGIAARFAAAIGG